ncbi:MAG: PAS domain S-box protein [Patescibacteria group bacterium]
MFNYFEALVNTAQAIVLVLDPEGKIVTYNPYMEEISGYWLKEAKGKDWFTTFLPKGDYDKIREVFKKSIKGVATKGIINPIVAKDGHEIIIEWNSKTLKDTNDNVLGVLSIGIDVSERIKLLDTLRKSEDKFLKAFNAFPYAITITRSEDGSFVEINSAFTEISGYTREEALASSSIMLNMWVNVDDRKQVVSDLKTGQPVLSREYLFKVKNGKIITALFSAQMIKLEQGLYVLSSIVDITERKQLETELARTNEDNINHLFNSVGDGLLLSELSAEKFFMGNKTICQMLGYSQEEIKKLGIKDIHPEKDVSYVLEQFGKQARGEIVTAKDLPVKRKDGSLFFADVSAAPISFGGKKYLLGIFHDNTDRLLKEKLLLESESKFRSIIMSSSDAIMTLEPPSWRFTSGNPATVAMFRVKDELEFISYEPWRLSPELQPDGQNSTKKAIEMIETAMREGSNRFDWKHKRLNGEVFDAEVILSKIDERGKTYLTALVRDKTVQRIIEENNLKIEELKQVNELKNEFLAMASHELRTPLAIIEQGVSLVLEQLSGPINPKQKEILETAQINVDRLTRLINDLLNISKIESRKVVSQPQSIDLIKTIEDIIKTLQPQAQMKKINLSLTLKPEKELNLCIDPDKLNEIFNNLLSNAIKFTSEQGKVWVEIVEKDTFVEISTHDNGKGIAKEDFSRLFAKFEQFDRTIGPGAKGTGLGLAISKGLVELLGGKIWAESELGKGSTFTFTIPKGAKPVC